MYTGPRHTLSMEAYYVLVQSKLGHAGPRFAGHGAQQIVCRLTMLQLGQRELFRDYTASGGMS
jgi:hypothetical protein